MSDQTYHIETQWLEGFRQGREQSFAAIFETLFPALSLYSFRLTNDHAVSEDIAQEALIKIWHRKENFFHFNALKSYLYTTVRNDTINYLQKKERQITGKKAFEAFQPDQETNRQEDLIRAEVFREVLMALETLPPKCQKIMKMLYSEGKTTRQVADELQLTLGTVKTQKVRGLMLLRKRLPHLLLLAIKCLITQFPF